MPAKTKIVSAYDSLPSAEKKVADFILKDPKRASLMVINDIAKAADVSVPSVTRLAKKLGYDGFMDFRVALAECSSESITMDIEPLRDDDADTAAIEKLFISSMRCIEETLKVLDAAKLSKFCDDIIEQTRELKDIRDGYRAVTARFFQWKKMFVLSRNTFLTEPEIMGLIGEILFLKNILSKEIGLSEALKSWSGQELTHKDFSCDNRWYEVKTINRGNPNVRISSLEQLDSEKDGELIVFSMEKMSAAYNGVTLNKLILETRQMFLSREESDDFLAKVALQGYEYNNYYDDFVFEISNVMRYAVGKEFPKLTSANVPKAIAKASYDISLSEIQSFIINK